jgi:drug/metabolite transporter (DMT)-like permease
LAFAYLTVIGSLVGYTAYVWLLQVSTPARVSTYAFVNPFVAVLLGHLVLKETLPESVAVAGALILASVILITRPAARPRST